MVHDRIGVDPAVKFGRPCIKGTRITVELVFRLLGKGWSIEKLIGEYPQLTEEDIRAALSYGADFLAGHKGGSCLKRNEFCGR